MLHIRNSIFLLLKNICPDSNKKEPFVNVQPRIFISKCIDHYNPNNSASNGNMSLASNVVSGRNRLLSLEFSICYDEYSGYSSNRNSENYKLDEVEVFIEKFRKTAPYTEIFDANLHIPKIIYLLQKPHKLGRFELFVSSFVTTKNHGDLKEGCQIVSLFFDQDPNPENILSLEQVIYHFRVLMGIQIYENSEDWGFRFGIRIKEKIPTNLSFPLPFIYTNMFKLIFSNDGLGVNLQNVDKRLYHCYH